MRVSKEGEKDGHITLFARAWFLPPARGRSEGPPKTGARPTLRVAGKDFLSSIAIVTEDGQVISKQNFSLEEPQYIEIRTLYRDYIHTNTSPGAKVFLMAGSKVGAECEILAVEIVESQP